MREVLRSRYLTRQRRSVTAVCREIARRSSFVTTNWSLARFADSNALSNSGRRASLPDALSRKISSHRAAVSASRWDSGFWSRVETRP